MAEGSSADLRVLVVDDDVDSATTLSYLLQMMGCRTAVAYGPDMALKVGKLFQPDLVFLDFEMPGGSGDELIVRMKQLEGRVPLALFVCLTGRCDDETRRRCESAGFDAFLSKPLDVKVMDGLLGAARQRVEKLASAQAPSGDRPLGAD